MLTSAVVYLAVAPQRAVERLFHPVDEKHRVFGGVPGVHQHRPKRQPPMLDATQHLLDMIELALAISVRVEDPVVDYPETLRFWVHVDARDYPYTTNHALLVAAPLLTHHLDVRAEALV